MLERSVSYRYIDDLISFNNERLKEFISDVSPKELTISETTKSTSVASYLDLLFTRDKNNNIITKLYDKCDAFGFHIVNFPFMLSNIPSTPVPGVYASQLIRYARCYSNYSDLLSRHSALVTRLLSNVVDCTSYNDDLFIIFPGFVKAELIKLAKMAGVKHEADHTYSI